MILLLLILRWLAAAIQPWTPTTVTEECDYCGGTIYIPVEQCGPWVREDDRMADAAFREHALTDPVTHVGLLGGEHG